MRYLRLHLLLALVGYLPVISLAFSPIGAARPIIKTFSSTSTGRTNTPLWAAAAAAATSTSTATIVPRLSEQHLQELARTGSVVVDNFLPKPLQQALREDVSNLRTKHNKFKVAKIGQDSTNQLNENIRVAETCFIGNDKLQDVPNPAREQLYNVLDQVRLDLSQSPVLQQEGAITRGMPSLDPNLSELLYAYYPKGGFYKRHCDAVPNSASVLREVSLLLYLNPDWTPDQGGQLRMHSDGGGDFLPEGASPNYRDVEPTGGTLVLFKSDLVPHEVLDTHAERVAVVGWYNRALSVSDISALSENGGKTQMLMLAVAAALVTVGVVSLVT